jgi:hypothetical protein
VRARALAVAALLASCAGTDPGANDLAAEALRVRTPPANTIPCNHPEYWPHELRSTGLPLRVHYMLTGDRAMAERVLAGLETAWRVEVDGLGFRPPPSDGGRCGADGAFDAFLWRGHTECYVDVLNSAPGVSWDARIGYMVVDPWGPYGGAILESTLAHEFNHACQMADDWSDCPIVYEMTADFMQKVVVPSDENYREYFADFQSHADWSLDRDDGYRTWYSYGAALYLFYLRDHYFGGDARFVAEMWRRMRNPPADDDPTLNHPSFEDALDVILGARAGIGFVDSVVELARWRWYTGPRDDGHHFVDGASFALVPSAAVAVGAGPGQLTVDAMVLGSRYLELSGAPGATLHLALASDAAVRWVAQAVPGPAGADGELVDLSAGEAPLSLGETGTRTLILTALPADPARYEPNKRHDSRAHATLTWR